ncbi:hypothetical protein EYF80_047819 [Liparis tanakae]|uniref:Uncharacterized protein n=1 Tax=Liparis tanakae TaxID=230148 RepID=A0A4Z2FLA0_9TELE|nr:hypothetical protein EYF80_047819 [Liparis tanakae]
MKELQPEPNYTELTARKTRSQGRIREALVPVHVSPHMQSTSSSVHQHVPHAQLLRTAVDGSRGLVVPHRHLAVTRGSTRVVARDGKG